jgi:hypothetical protein
VEVYFPTYGWVSFDPTPAEGRETQALLLGRLSLYLDAFQTFWEEWIINYDFVRQLALARQVERTSRQLRSDSRQFFGQRYRHVVAMLRQRTENLLGHRAGMALVLLLVSVALLAVYGRSALQVWLGEWGMRRRARQGKARPEDATLLYLRLLRVLARRGIRKSPEQTPNEFAAAVPEPAQAFVRNFTSLYMESRFGRFTGSLARLDSLLDEIRAQRLAR